MTCYIETPLVPSRPLTRLIDRPVFLKLENFQTSGSCKGRGLGRFCQKAAERGARSFTVSPGGNAALAVAYAGHALGLLVHAVLPLDTSPRLLLRLADMGAKFTQYGKTWEEAEAFGLAQAEQNGSVYVPGYNHSDVWEGHSTIVDEIAKMGIKPGIIVLAVGGGGLLCGVIEGLRRAGWDDTPIVAAELRNTGSLDASIRASRLVSASCASRLHPAIAGPPQICSNALSLSLAYRIMPRVVDEHDAIAACGRFTEEHFMKIEPMTGAVFSLIYKQAALFDGYDSVLALVGGGSSIVIE